MVIEAIRLFTAIQTVFFALILAVAPCSEAGFIHGQLVQTFLIYALCEFVHAKTSDNATRPSDQEASEVAQ